MDKFVFFLPNTDYYRIPYNDLNKEQNAEIVDALLDSSSMVIRMLYLFHMSDRINSIIRLPLKKIWFNLYYKKKYDGNNFFFVFFDAQLRKCTIEYREYLKKHYPGCHIILFLTDIVASFKSFDLEKIEQFSDLVLTYEAKDAATYGFKYYPDVYSKLASETLDSEYEECDLLFAGYKKNRMDLILDIYSEAKKNNVKCKFVVPDYQGDESIIKQRIQYIEYLKQLQKAKCILEIEQEGATGYTLRTLEALAYNKKLLTTNTNIVNASFYDEDFIQIIKNVSDIDFSWINMDKMKKTDISSYEPCKLVEFLKNEFNE
ncbi:MAG: hypothetical protein K6F77_02815 [Lachnospiraceae bacterium]|nr:hypothetical protein [Lachnospiraceae bacterium]